jgi:outer membrane lipoprotein-sorting protein
MRKTMLGLALSCLAATPLLAACGGQADAQPAATSAKSALADYEADRGIAADEAKTSEAMDGAYDTCIQAITEQLKAPATAQFSDRSDESERVVSKDHYAFTGTVDAENGFGALLRSDWSCQISQFYSGRFIVDDATVS